ncbi:probable (S)-N-methylcoclaurine 3'-hydroxylase isozyme 2 [Pistacia vera]|uniref:probable (S)-N-methylcoclaurine 3'-hydroxylase isozyme 2 n=1 Tax=Pistacia vera TaxID=55513 RepID=UPI0012634171|nr:probable (S)-N-methylcoclaurine 3'-hydroxylase isozyme 2 [Pistacia vera]
MNKIREELAQGVSEDFVTEENLANLPYLYACVKETLRLHPPAPLLLPHRAIEDCEVMKYTIPKDSQVFVNVWAIARDPTIWEKPLSFKPERFLNSSLDYKGYDFQYLPFGSGRKICAGMPMAIRQVQLGLASLIHHFEWSLPDTMKPQKLDMNEKFGVTLLKLQPLVVISKARK